MFYFIKFHIFCMNIKFIGNFDRLESFTSHLPYKAKKLECKDFDFQRPQFRIAVEVRYEFKYNGQIMRCAPASNTLYTSTMVIAYTLKKT